MDSSIWGLIIVVALMVLFLYMRSAPMKGLKNISSNDLQNELQGKSNSMLIDVREKHEYKGGYIPGAVNIPLSEIRNRLNEIPQNKKIFLYCHSGMRSKQAAAILLKNGHSELAQLQGGISAWKGKIKK